MESCKGWNLKIGRLDVLTNSIDYFYTNKTFTDYNEMKSYKSFLETNKSEQKIHKTIVEESVIWQ